MKRNKIHAKSEILHYRLYVERRGYLGKYLDHVAFCGANLYAVGKAWKLTDVRECVTCKNCVRSLKARKI